MDIKQFYVDLSIFGPRQAGVALYSLEMARYLEGTFHCKVIVPPYYAHHFKDPIVCRPPLALKGSVIWRNPFGWTDRIKLGSGTLLYCPHAYGTALPVQQVLTMHDLIPYHYPTRNHFENFYYRVIFPRLVKRVPLVCTVSNTTKIQLCERFNLSPIQVEVVPNGIDTKRWRPAESFQAEADYLLVVSANRPYKNIIELLQNHDLWIDSYRLKIVSSRSRYAEQIKATVLELGIQNQVDFLEKVSDEELIRLYQNAAAGIYPSLIEGFGRPPLESMAAGRPVILSDIPVHKEIFGEAGIFITPGDRNSWADAFSTLQDASVIERSIDAGYQLAAQYSLQNIHQVLDAALVRHFPSLNNLRK
jgi:glycosyltransferase involved in cell wall biosynthesis